MTAQGKKWFGNDRQTMSHQIHQAVSRLDRRKQEISKLTEALGSKIKSECVSPGGLWIAGSTGFLVAEWLHRPSSDAAVAVPRQTPQSPRLAQASVQSRLVLLVKFVLDLRTLWAKVNPGPVQSA